MKLVIADDNTAFRKTLKSILADIDGMEIAGEAGTVPEAIQVIREEHPDVIILDIHMPGGSGFDVLREIRWSLLNPVVIMLTVGSKRDYRSTSILTGADYFFEKSSELGKMIRMLRNCSRAK